MNIKLISPRLSLIFAKSNNNVIGKAGAIPWHCSADFKWFKSKTQNHITIMGRNTWESIGSKPLSDRINIVVTTQPDYVAKGAIVASDLHDAIAKGCAEQANAHVFVIGGKRLLEEAACLAKDVYITEINIMVDIDATCVMAPELPLAHLDTIDELFSENPQQPAAKVIHYHF